MTDSLGKITIGEASFDIVLDDQPAVFVDCISEGAEVNGVFRIGLASIVVDGDGAPRAKVSARLRMNSATATDLRNMLTQLLDGNSEAREKAN